MALSTTAISWITIIVVVLVAIFGKKWAQSKDLEINKCVNKQIDYFY